MFLRSALQYLGICGQGDDAQFLHVCGQLIVYSDQCSASGLLSFEVPWNEQTAEVVLQGTVVRSLGRSSNIRLAHEDTCQSWTADGLCAAPLLYCWTPKNTQPHSTTLGISPRNPLLYDRHLGGIPWLVDVPPGSPVEYVETLSESGRQEQHLSNYLELWLGVPATPEPARHDMTLTILDPLITSRALAAAGASVYVSGTGGVRVACVIPPGATRFHGSSRISATINFFSNMAVSCTRVWGWRPYSAATASYDLPMVSLGETPNREGGTSEQNASLFSRGYGPFRVADCSLQVQAQALVRPGNTSNTLVLVCGLCGFGGIRCGEMMCDLCGASPAYLRSEMVSALTRMRGAHMYALALASAALRACLAFADETQATRSRRPYLNIATIIAVGDDAIQSHGLAGDWEGARLDDSADVVSATQGWRRFLMTRDTETAENASDATRDVLA